MAAGETGKGAHMTLVAVIATVLYLESRGEPESAMRGVASVMVHRSHQRGESLQQVATDSSFFTSLQHGKVPHPSEMAPTDFGAWLLCGKIAAEMVSGRFKPVINANHFHDVSVYPGWARRMAYVEKRGRFCFYFEEGKA
jgi:spore germination cell wall hydrolase CwlJ-like protein